MDFSCNSWEKAASMETKRTTLTLERPISSPKERGQRKGSKSDLTMIYLPLFFIFPVIFYDSRK